MSIFKNYNNWITRNPNKVLIFAVTMVMVIKIHQILYNEVVLNCIMGIFLDSD
jgi:hypothetical protein